MWSGWPEHVVGFSQGGLSISETADLLEFSQISDSRVYTYWVWETETLWMQSSVYENTLLMRENKEELTDWFKLTGADTPDTIVTQLTTLYISYINRKTSLHEQYYLVLEWNY